MPTIAEAESAVEIKAVLAACAKRVITLSALALAYICHLLLLFVATASP